MVWSYDDFYVLKNVMLLGTNIRPTLRKQWGATQRKLLAIMSRVRAFFHAFQTSILRDVRFNGGSWVTPHERFWAVSVQVYRPLYQTMF